MSGFWTGRDVVVTGGEGFIGSNLVECLARAGANVTVFAHYKPYGAYGHLSELLGDIRIIAGDIRDEGQIRNALKGADTVFHLAALIGIPYSYEAPQSYVQTNVEGTRIVVDAAKYHGLRRVVHTSTSEVYGSALSVPISERHPLQPQSPYAASKIAADAIAMSYFYSFGTPVSICRPFNTFGPRQSGRAVIPSILRQLVAGTERLEVGSLAPTRDFTYVTDTVQGFLAIAESNETVGSTFNLGTGFEISIGDLVEMLLALTGSRAAVVPQTERHRPKSSEVQRLVSDNSAVRALTGWAPTVTLKEGLKRTLAWIQEHRSLGHLTYER